jgi:hypothetical protein
MYRHIDTYLYDTSQLILLRKLDIILTQFDDTK